MQEIYGKLLHVASVLPQGRVYLTGLESMLVTCAKKPFILHRPDIGLDQDLSWWLEKLKNGTIICSIQPPPLFLDLQVFSDAGSGFGIGIIIGSQWRAWHLRPDWSTLHGKKDIRWAEAIGFELLICAVDIYLSKPRHIILYGDNTGIVEGWRCKVAPESWGIGGSKVVSSKGLEGYEMFDPRDSRREDREEENA